MTAQHTPVMLKEVVEALAPKDNDIYIDGTFGRGGFSRALLSAASTKVYGIDRDPDAIASGKKMAEEFSPRLKLSARPLRRHGCIAGWRTNPHG